ncbi:MAG: type II toxin-antitoxin system Phd/YefM family antitoxin [Chloroflexota bacterium]
MRTVSAMDMRKRLGEILDAASAGERILIERDHQPLAYLISVEDAARLNADRDDLLARRSAAMDRLMALGAKMREEYPEPDDGLSTSEWIRQDHMRRAERILENARGGESAMSDE